MKSVKEKFKTVIDDICTKLKINKTKFAIYEHPQVLSYDTNNLLTVACVFQPPYSYRDDINFTKFNKLRLYYPFFKLTKEYQIEVIKHELCHIADIQRNTCDVLDVHGKSFIKIMKEANCNLYGVDINKFNIDVPLCYPYDSSYKRLKSKTNTKFLLLTK